MDQLTRSVLCDPAQDVSRASSRPFSSRVRMSANARGDSTPINLHQTLVNPTNKTVNEAVLDKRIQFDARVICRDGSIALKVRIGKTVTKKRCMFCVLQMFLMTRFILLARDSFFF